MNPVPNLAAFVLAGGKSTRMGSDKAFLKIGGRTLLEHALSLARSLTSDVSIVGNTTTFSRYARTVEDIFPERGPLGGIHAALRSSRSDLNLMLSVDTPFIPTQFLRYLVEQTTVGAVVTVPRVAGRWQPLCAVYHARFADAAELALASGQNKIDLLFSQVAVRALDESDWQPLGFSADIFRNLNTPEEFRDAQTSSEASTD
jgi:molybdopterin-guanine dinucleotide biosynthesis protein A